MAAVSITSSAPSYLYYRHTLPVRIMHWTNFIALTVLFMSGLHIFNAHSALYWGDSSYSERPPLLQITARDGANGERIGVTNVFGREFETTGVLDLGGGDDEVLVDFSGLTIEGATDQAPVSFAVLGGAGDDSVIIVGTAVGDMFTVTDTNVVLEGAGELSYATFESLLVDGLGGNDTMTITGSHAGTQTTLAGGAGNDVLIGGSGRDILIGGVGDDLLIGGAGNDWIEGGEGDDALSGGFGDDTLLGGPGRDVLVGGPGRDLIEGGGNAAFVMLPARQRAGR